MNAATALLLSFLAWLPAPTAGDERLDAVATVAPQAWSIEQPSLSGGSRRLVARGMAPAAAHAPWVVVATASDAPAARADAWIEALARRGYAAIRLDRPAGEPWWRQAEAIEQLVALLRTEATTPDHPRYGRLDPRRVALLAEGDGAAAAARAAATIADLDGVLLLDPRDASAVLPWLGRIAAPVATIASGGAHEEQAQAWFRASRKGETARWFVAFAGGGALPTAAETERRVLERDVRELCVAFTESLLPLDGQRPQNFGERARTGTIDRRVELLANGARVVLADAH